MSTAPRLYDLQPPVSDFRADVLAGLGSEQPFISPKYFYDDRGSELFDRICTTSEYYLTRTEVALLRQVAHEIAVCAGPDAMILEMGVGMSTKVEILLSALQTPALYAATDINRMALEEALAHLNKMQPELPLAGIVTDFTKLWDLPDELTEQGAGRLCFMPGSTVGNFSPSDRQQLLSSIRRLVGTGGRALLGVDLIKERNIIERAYNDKEGITAQFNLNVLYRLRRELDVRVDPATFRHHAFYNSDERRIEMHLVAQSRQEIQLGDQAFLFNSGDSIHTENSYKFSLDEWEAMARKSGFSDCRCWTDSQSWFGLILMTA